MTRWFDFDGLRSVGRVALTLAAMLCVRHAACRADESPVKTGWGEIVAEGADTGVLRAKVETRPADGELPLPAPLANITRAYLAADRERRPLLLEFNQDASEIALHLAGEGAEQSSGDITLETAEKSQQFADGRIVFSALDATIHGERAKLETHPGNHRIGFWSDANDHVAWKYKATRPGTYDVELTYSGFGNDGTLVEVAVGEAKLAGELASTGSWYRYTTLPVGKVQIPAAEAVAVAVRCTKKMGGAVMNLKAVTLRPACEGAPPVQNVDGVIECHARDATIHGVKVRYEPQPHKNTVGYWANPRDRVGWWFQLKKPGPYTVEILQGCGKGQGGSEVTLSVDGQPLQFTVEDTGHFQNFVARKIGHVRLDKPGWCLIEVRPDRKAGVAVMDLRRVRLIPAKAE